MAYLYSFQLSTRIGHLSIQPSIDPSTPTCTSQPPEHSIIFSTCCYKVLLYLILWILYLYPFLRFLFCLFLLFCLLPFAILYCSRTVTSTLSYLINIHHWLQAAVFVTSKPWSELLLLSDQRLQLVRSFFWQNNPGGRFSWWIFF